MQQLQLYTKVYKMLLEDKRMFPQRAYEAILIKRASQVKWYNVYE